MLILTFLYNLSHFFLNGQHNFIKTELQNGTLKCRASSKLNYRLSLRPGNLPQARTSAYSHRGIQSSYSGLTSEVWRTLMVLYAALEKVIQALARFSWWEAKFCKRSANEVADMLGKLDHPSPVLFPSSLPQGMSNISRTCKQCWHTTRWSPLPNVVLLLLQPLWPLTSLTKWVLCRFQRLALLLVVLITWKNGCSPSFPVSVFGTGSYLPGLVLM